MRGLRRTGPVLAEPLSGRGKDTAVFFGESLLGKETYWQTASGRRAVTRPDTDVVPPGIQPEGSRPEE